MVNLFDEALNVIERLGQAGIDYALVGGLAVGIYTAPRATEDIDLVVRAADWARIAEVLGEAGYEDQSGIIHLDGGKLELRRLIKLMPQLEDHVLIDFLLDSYPPARLALEQRITVAWAGRPLQLGSIENLVRLKNQRRSSQDLLDISALNKLLDKTNS